MTSFFLSLNLVYVSTYYFLFITSSFEIETWKAFISGWFDYMLAVSSLLCAKGVFRAEGISKCLFIFFSDLKKNERFLDSYGLPSLESSYFDSWIQYKSNDKLRNELFMLLFNPLFNRSPAYLFLLFYSLKVTRSLFSLFIFWFFFFIVCF